MVHESVELSEVAAFEHGRAMGGKPGGVGIAEPPVFPRFGIQPIERAGALANGSERAEFGGPMIVPAISQD
jgi:hypothetical protein